MVCELLPRYPVQPVARHGPGSYSRGWIRGMARGMRIDWGYHGKIGDMMWIQYRFIDSSHTQRLGAKKLGYFQMYGRNQTNLTLGVGAMFQNVRILHEGIIFPHGALGKEHTIFQHGINWWFPKIGVSSNHPF